MQVILTRPEGENEALAERLKDHEVLTLPLIQLLELPQSEVMKKTVTDLDLFDEIIFVSKSAVRHAMPLLEIYWPQWPLKLNWLAVGEGTAAALESFGVRASFPGQAGSEGLLALPELIEVNGHRILISRGRGGRELLASELARRGARVEYLETYERIELEQPGLTGIQDGAVLVVTSAEIMESAITQLAGREKVMQVVVPSERIESLALDRGFCNVVNARGASEQSLYDAVMSCIR
ncbi:MAG: uroporphyrinogen-III synthase [Pseudomonadales bacterium]|jgi:uroporphyrinogen-III synthase|nr:uroporphyrinogen-III synthase [Pseudomonadales bacterium]